MSITWAQRLARLSTIIGTDIVTNDEEQQGRALDEYLASHDPKDQKDINLLRFSDNDLIFIGKLADGQFGTIDVVRCRLDSKVYIRKTVEKRTALRARGVGRKSGCTMERNEFKRKLLTQAARTNSLWAPHLLCAFQTNTALKFIMQYADGGNLWDLIESLPDGKISEHDLKWWLPQIVNAIDWCHSQGFIHRDVKPHNFVITPSSRILLVDFGSAAPLLPPSSSGVQIVPKEYCLVPCGTCDYISPEILQCHEEALVALELEEDSSHTSRQNGPGEISCYGRETDWWSFGAMVYEMTYGVAPFFAQDIGRTYVKIMDHRTNLRYDGTATLSHSGISLIKGLLRDCETRLGRHSTNEIRQHQFFQYMNWESLHEQQPPDRLHVPQFTYSVTATERLGNNGEDQGYDESSEQYTQPFQFSVLFQSSQTIPGASFLQNTPLPSKNNNNLTSVNAFIGFSWGPRLSVFTTATTTAHSVPDLRSQTILHREPVLLTPRPPSVIRSRSAFVPPTQTTSQPFITPIRRTSLPFSQGGYGNVTTLQRTTFQGTGQSTKEIRPLSDREAMQQLVDCVGMSAHKKVLASGKKPRFLQTLGSQKGSKGARLLFNPLAAMTNTNINTNTPSDGYASGASSETESQPASPTPRPSSALSRNGWGGRSTPSLMAGRSTTPTLTFITTATTLGTGGFDPSGTLNHPNESLQHGNRIFNQRLEDVERRYDKLLSEISNLEEDVGNVTLRMSRTR
ncbi:hypothetical protein Clacol_008267 [Clathrus columnatus]|uniref:Protein kinase domain-containing protein n=1 Tax=Clathrus columnatus TaxID=1419009 RepID=A0AAV5AHZ5_9AGAM|nr:hypothetical protein Clacol_008267 [Clathrus columnatus]